MIANSLKSKFTLSEYDKLDHIMQFSKDTFLISGYLSDNSTYNTPKNLVFQTFDGGKIWKKIYFKFRPDNIERYARRVSMEEIEKNGYNLNISRYVSTSLDEVQIDLSIVNTRLTSINESIKVNTDKHNEFLRELGLFEI